MSEVISMYTNMSNDDVVYIMFVVLVFLWIVLLWAIGFFKYMINPKSKQASKTAITKVYPIPLSTV